MSNRNPAEKLQKEKIFDVEGSLEKLRRRPTAEGVLHFFQELQGAEFLVPCEGKATNVAVLNLSNGDNLIPVFTNVDELKPGLERWKEVTALRLEFLALCVMSQPAQFTGLVLNPLGRRPVLIHRKEIMSAMKLLKAYNNKDLN